MNQLTKEEVRKRVLGKSMTLNEVYPGVDLSRDLSFVTGPNGKDLDWKSGFDCLGQALTVALTTAKTTDVFNTNFGFDGINAMVEETNPMLVRERIRIAVIQLLQRDPRIRTILDVQLLDGRLTPLTSSEGLASASSTQTDSSRKLVVQVSFETVTAEQFTIRLGE